MTTGVGLILRVSTPFSIQAFSIMTRSRDLSWAWKESPADLLQRKTMRVSKLRRDAFFRSAEWLELRYQALKLHGRKCQCCGRSPPEVVLNVDHIKPRIKFPELQLEISNLQVLCRDCNLGKGFKDQTDWRPKP